LCKITTTAATTTTTTTTTTAAAAATTATAGLSDADPCGGPLKVIAQSKSRANVLV
jgi:hypothetical protein